MRKYWPELTALAIGIAITALLLFTTAASAQCVTTVPPYVAAYFTAFQGWGCVSSAHTAGTSNNYAIGEMGFGLLDSGGAQGNAWARYTESIVTPGQSGRMIGEENSLVNQGPVLAGRDPYNWNGITNTNLMLDCGDGQSGKNENECGTALVIAPNTQSYKNGIIFANGAIDGGQAIAMPAYDYIFWEASDGSNAWLQHWPGDMHIHSSNLLTLDVAQIKIGGTMAAPYCSGPPSPSFQVVAGIVTHC